MVTSIGANPGSATAVQSLNKTNDDQQTLLERLSSGKKADGPKPDPATFAIAQQLLGEIGGSTAVSNGLNAAEATLGVAQAAGQAVGDVLVDLKSIALQASQQGLDENSRLALETEFNALRDQIGTIVDGASFNGTNLIESGAEDLNVQADAEGNRINVSAADLSETGLGIDALNLSTVAQSQAAGQALDAAIADASSKLANLGASANRIETQADATVKLRDSLRQGVGNLVDADLGAEAAVQAAASARQALNAQSLSIANAAPRLVFGLF